MSIWQADLREAFQPALVGYFYFITLIAFFATWRWAHLMLPRLQRGVFVQGSFRGNCGVMSLALAANYFGDYGLSVGGVLAGFTILIFNVLSVFILSFYSPTLQFSVKKVLKDVATNPLIISVVLGLLASAIRLHIPEPIVVSGRYFGGLTLPLALICAGGTLSLAGLKESGKAAMQASIAKIILLPIVGCLLAALFGFDRREIIILWLFFSTPTAAASFSMALAAGGDGKLAANIIALSTVVSIVTIILGVFVINAI